MKKKFSQYLYPAIFIRDEENGSYQVVFPDLNIYTEAENLSVAYLAAKDLLKVFLSYAFRYDTDFNLPSRYEDILPRCKENETIMYVDAYAE